MLNKHYAISKNICVKCEKPPTFYSEPGRKEYLISGLYEPCFDNICNPIVPCCNKRVEDCVCPQTFNEILPDLKGKEDVIIKDNTKVEDFMSKSILQKLAAALPNTRYEFETSVEAAALEVTEIAKDISKAIGEISIDEAKDAIIQIFSGRLKK